MVNTAKLIMHGGEGLEGEHQADSAAEALALIARYYGHEDFATTLEEIIADPGKQQGTYIVMDQGRISVLREMAAIRGTGNGEDTAKERKTGPTEAGEESA